jgi:predicted RNase H-like HicB family nuclease
VEKSAKYSQKTARNPRAARLKEPGIETGQPAPFPFLIEIERENDGRYIAEIPSIPGVMVYGATRSEAIEKVRVLALEVLADQARSPRRSRQVAALFDVA